MKTNYFSHSRPEMLPFIPENATSILEIGCASGAFAKSVLHLRNDIEYWGVEPEKEAAAEAQKYLSRLLNQAFEDAIPHIPKRYFDCVVMNDVLEHFDQTDFVLRTASEALKTDGILVLSIPNVRYIEHIKEYLFDGDWRYREEGILDRTHLRFFTKKSIVRKLSEHRFRVSRMEGVNQTSRRKDLFLLKVLGKRFSDMKYLQFAIQAQKLHDEHHSPFQI